MAVEAAAAPLYYEPLLLLGGAVIAAPLFARIGLGTILGYLAAGIAIGPGSPAHIGRRGTAPRGRARRGAAIVHHRS